MAISISHIPLSQAIVALEVLASIENYGTFQFNHILTYK